VRRLDLAAEEDEVVARLHGAGGHHRHERLLRQRVERLQPERDVEDVEHREGGADER